MRQLRINHTKYIWNIKEFYYEISKNINRIVAIVICTETERWKECKNEKLFSKVENIWLQLERFSSFVRLCTNIGFLPGSFIQVTGCTSRQQSKEERNVVRRSAIVWLGTYSFRVRGTVRKISFQTVKIAGEFRALSSFLSEIGGGASAAIDRIPSVVRGIYSDWILRIMADLAKLRCSIRSSIDYLNDIDALD